MCNYMNLLRALAQHGLRVFSLEDAMEILKEHDLSETYSKKIFHLMGKKGDLHVLGKGLYALPTELLSGGPLHSFEIGMKLVKKGAISHRSAMFFHDLTDQVLTHIYLVAPKVIAANKSTKADYVIDHTRFHVKRINPSSFFGIKRVFINESPIWVTDIERTLLDGLMDPQLCGGFREVLHAFEKGYDKISQDTFLKYIDKMPIVIAKRAGWVLERIQCLEEVQHQLEAIPTKTIQKLNLKGERRGALNKRWFLMENI